MLNTRFFSLQARFILYSCFASICLLSNRVRAETEVFTDREIELPPPIVEDSPVLQKWLRQTPNVLREIYRDPSFRTRLNLGFIIFPSSDDVTGIEIGIEDIFLGRTGLTLSADYQTSFNSDRVSTGGNLHYFLFPLGGYVNLAPLVGYRYVQSNDFNTDGVNLGLRLMLALSRTGAADISVSQSFVSPRSDREVGLFSVAVGYSVTPDIRLSTSWKLQNSLQDKDNSASIGLQYSF